MQKKRKKRALKVTIIIVLLLIPIVAAALGFYWVGEYYRDEEKIYPNISIAGVDVSWLTKEEALQSLNLADFEHRAGNASVTITFPDYSELTILGEDINLRNDAHATVESAFNMGRGRGFIQDTISFIRRYYDNFYPLDVHNIYDVEVLNAKVAEFTEDFNNRLAATEPVIYSDKIVFTKGAGEKPAEIMVLQDLAYIGLFESFETGQPSEIEYILPETGTNAQLIFELNKIIAVPVVSATLNAQTLSVSDCVIGVNFDLMNAVELLNVTETGKTVAIPIEFTEPDTTREYLESLLFRDLIGEQTTWVHGASGRVTNIEISAEAINSLILTPGEEFSFNEVVGARHTSRGYKMGGAIVGGEMVSVIGGGICQTASTLYSAIRDTELKVTERHPHSRPIPYLPRGRDATVFWNRLDFRFVNNTEFPLRIDFELDGRHLTAKVYGTIIDDFPTPSLPMPAG